MSPHPSPTTLMQHALAQAEQAASQAEIPVGAIVVAPDGHTILGRGHNRCIADHDPSAHAEIQAMRQAARALGNYRLEGCTLYVTLEPCAMCSGAMLHARLAQVIYAVPDPRTGAAGSVLNLLAPSGINHQTTASLLPDADGGAELWQACADLLTRFFRSRRQQQARQRQQADHAPLREDALRPSAASLKAEGVWQPDSRWTLVPDPAAPASAAWRMYHLEQGDAAARSVVLLHGYAGHARLWQELASRISAAGWRTLAPDLPGHGLSDKPRKADQHQLAWHQSLLAAWAQAQQLPADTRWITLDQAALLLPANIPPEQVLALDSPDAAVRWPDDSRASSSHDWRLRCQRSPVFDLQAHWAIPDQATLLQASYPDAGHRTAMRWPLWAGQPASELDRQYGLQHGRRLPVHTLEPVAEALAPPGARIRAALRHNSPMILHWLQQARSAN